jgi:uncharacterized membrane protein
MTHGFCWKDETFLLLLCSLCMSETQQAINQAEWNRPENWSGPKLFGLYSSKADTRLWVPKRTPALGWTFNLGHQKGKVVFATVLVGVAGLLITCCAVGIIILRITVAALHHIM